MRFRSLNSYQITEEKYQHFLLEERNDPVTGDSFFEGDEVVFCSICKSAFLKDSWSYMGNKHCDQRSTLPIFPTAKKLTLQKPIELPFNFISIDQRVAAFSLDILVLVVICSALFVLGVTSHFTSNSYFYLFLGFVLFTFRDSILLNKSFGKAATGLYFIDTITNLPATFWQTLGRNLLYWVMNGIFILGLIITKALEGQMEDTDAAFILISFIAIATHILYIKHNVENNYSWFDKLLGIRLVKKK